MADFSALHNTHNSNDTLPAQVTRHEAQLILDALNTCNVTGGGSVTNSLIMRLAQEWDMEAGYSKVPYSELADSMEENDKADIAQAIRDYTDC